MGIKLQDLIIKKNIELSHLAGKIIAIDAPNIILGLFNFTRKNTDDSYGDLILDRTQRPISHLYGLLYRINFYYSKKLFPIFCFDGQDSQLKKIKTKDKLKDFLFTQEWYHKALTIGDKKLARRIALSNEYKWNNIIIESKRLIGDLGIPIINSPSSAESQCAQLVKTNMAYFSNSQDFDSLLFGAPRIIQNLSKSLRRKVQGKWVYKKVSPQVINLRSNLNNLGINQFQLVDMAILIGTDYFPGIEGIGPKKALKLIKKYLTIESIMNYEMNNYNFDTLSPELVKRIRKIFLLPEVLKKFQNGDICWNSPNDTQVMSLLCEEHHLNKERVQNNLNKLMNNFERCRAYFSPFKNKSPSIQTSLKSLL